MWMRLVRFGFYLLYNQLAWTYDAVAWVVSLGEWARWRRAAMPFVCGERMLELAHGTGHILNSLHEAGFDTVGMDLSPFMGRIAQRRTGGRVPLVRGRGQGVPFSADTFDTILVTFPTPFIIKRETLLELRRVLVADGRLVIVPSGWLKGRGLVERVIAGAFAATGQRAGDDGVEAWLQPVTDAGFSVRVERVELARSWVIVVVAENSPC